MLIVATVLSAPFSGAGPRSYFVRGVSAGAWKFISKPAFFKACYSPEEGREIPDRIFQFGLTIAYFVRDYNMIFHLKLIKIFWV